MFALDLAAVTAWAASILVIASGLAKFLRTAPASRALAAAALPSGPAVVRALAVVEAAIGGAFVLRPSAATGVLLAGLYLAFAAFLAALLRHPAQASTCGCLGERHAPPSRLHVVLDVVAAGAAAGVAALSVAGHAPPGLIAQAGRLGWSGVPFVVGVTLAAWLAALAVAHLPSLLGSWRRPA
jgi:hypothetical protein